MTGATPLTPEPLSAILQEGSPSPALICPDDGTVVSHGELASAVHQLAGVLAGLGVARGQRVALVLANGPEIVELLLAVALCGATAAPMNPGYTEAEYKFYLNDLDPSLLVVQAGRGADVRRAAGELMIADVSVQRQGPPQLSVAGIEATAERSFDPGSPEDVALLLHTSGTTRRPKRVPLLQRNLMASLRAIGVHYRLDEADVSYCAMPLFHVHGLIASTLAQLAAGGSVVTPRRLTRRRYWQQVSTHGVTWVSASPTTHQELMEHGTAPAYRSAVGARLLRTLRTIGNPDYSRADVRPSPYIYAAPRLARMPAHAADRVFPGFAVAAKVTSDTFPQSRLVHIFTSRFRGNAYLPADSAATSCHAAYRASGSA